MTSKEPTVCNVGGCDREVTHRACIGGYVCDVHKCRMCTKFYYWLLGEIPKAHQALSAGQLKQQGSDK
jgi:hypothetical protein